MTLDTSGQVYHRPTLLLFREQHDWHCSFWLRAPCPFIPPADRQHVTRVTQTGKRSIVIINTSHHFNLTGYYHAQLDLNFFLIFPKSGLTKKKKKKRKKSLKINKSKNIMLTKNICFEWYKCTFDPGINAALFCPYKKPSLTSAINRHNVLNGCNLDSICGRKGKKNICILLTLGCKHMVSGLFLLIEGFYTR